MFKRANYSKRSLSTFEIVGSFIVDLYYNHFYQEAKRIRIEGRVESVTDGYKHAIKAYLNSFENPESYRKTIVGIHKYYYTTTRFSTISFSECVNEIVKHFIPEDFFESTTNQQRDGILRMVLMNAVKQFSSDILCSNLLDSLIDNHSESGLVRRMQDKMVQALMFEREKMFQKIFTVSNKPKDGGDFTIVMKMKTEMVKLVKENHALTGKYNKLKEKAVELLNILKEQKEKLEKLQEQNNSKPEHSEHEPNRKAEEYRHRRYDQYPEQQFDRYREEQNRSHIDREDRTIYIPDDSPHPKEKEKYPYKRPPRTDMSYRPEPPPNNITVFDKYQPYSDLNHISQQDSYAINSDPAKYNEPQTVISESKEEELQDNTASYATEDDNDPEPVVSMRPSDEDFFNNNMLNIE